MQFRGNGNTPIFLQYVSQLPRVSMWGQRQEILALDSDILCRWTADMKTALEMNADDNKTTRKPYCKVVLILFIYICPKLYTYMHTYMFWECISIINYDDGGKVSGTFYYYFCFLFLIVIIFGFFSPACVYENGTFFFMVYIYLFSLVVSIALSPLLKDLIVLKVFCCYFLLST